MTLPNFQSRICEALENHGIPGLTPYELALRIYGTLADNSRMRMLTLFIAAEADVMTEKGLLIRAIVRGDSYSYSLSVPETT